MGSLDSFELNEIGQKRMTELRAFGKQGQDIVNKMRQLAVSYNGYRALLDPVVDADDIVYSDASLDYMCDQLKPILDALSVDEKVWLDAVMDSLGYQPKPAE